MSTAATIVQMPKAQADRARVQYRTALNTAVPAELIPDGGVVAAAGYLKLRSWKDEALAKVLGQARQRRCTVGLNVCIPHAVAPDARRFLRLLPEVDVFVPNEDEARVLTGKQRPAAQARVLREGGARVVVIT